MTDVAELLSVSEAAHRLGISVEDCYDLVFSRTLRSVPAPTGRRRVPADAVRERLVTQR
jgi:excisionase family DNA binding protein